MSIRRAARYACTVSAQCICIVHDCGHAGPYNYICSISRTESFVTGSHTYRQHSANSEQVSTITCMYGPHVRTVLVGTHANRCQTMELAHHPHTQKERHTTDILHVKPLYIYMCVCVCQSRESDQRLTTWCCQKINKPNFNKRESEWKIFLRAGANVCTVCVSHDCV